MIERASDKMDPCPSNAELTTRRRMTRRTSISNPIYMLALGSLLSLISSYQHQTWLVWCEPQNDGMRVDGFQLSERQLDENSHLARSEFPRQLFRLHILDSRSSGSALQNRHSRQSHRSASRKSSQESSSQGQDKVIGSDAGKTISNGMLKKLLSQALLSKQQQQVNNRTQPVDVASNELPLGGHQKLAPSNFKFVFIQRAASNGTHNPSTRRPSDEAGGGGGSSSSLAVSVSKQLANSLLYSAANLVGNLSQLSVASSQAPSISLLKTQLLKQQQHQHQHQTEIASTNQNGEKEINRIATAQSEPAGPSDLQGSSKKLTSSSAEINSIKIGDGMGSSIKKGNKQTKYRKNSKIYNLPVKFVSNGQPSMIVLHTIRQHLAAMKRIQQTLHQATSPGPAATDGQVRHAPNNPLQRNQDKENTGGSSSSGTKSSLKIQLAKAVTGSLLSSSLGQPGNSGATRTSPSVKGVNSRLIYLPLRLLANGKPAKISITNRVSHSSSFIKKPSAITTTPPPTTPPLKQQDNEQTS